MANPQALGYILVGMFIVIFAIGLHREYKKRVK